MSGLDVESEAPSASAARAQGRGRLEAWAWAAALVVATRVVFFAIAYAGNWFFTSEAGHPAAGVFDIWARWDARSYLALAETGYGDERSLAWFPMYPLVVRMLTVAGFSPLLAGLTVSALASVVATAGLYRLTETEAGRGAGRRAALYLLLFPTAVFLVAPYSEALFLAGAVWAFVLARQGQWALAGFPAAVAVGTRTIGVFVVAGLALEFARQRNFSRTRVLDAALALVLGSLPFFAYAAYLRWRTGDPLYFVTAQSIGWGRSFVGPVTSFRATWQTWYGSDPANWILVWRLEIVAAAAGLVLLALLLRRREWGYAIYVAGPLALLMSSTWYYSIPRILLVFFPLHVLLADWAGRREWRHDLVLLTFAPLAAFGVIAFTREAWLA